jgi:hypothetical protein
MIVSVKLVPCLGDKYIELTYGSAAVIRRKT